MSLHMLLGTQGGFDYTGADCCGWLHDVGFRETRVWNTWSARMRWWWGSNSAGAGGGIGVGVRALCRSWPVVGGMPMSVPEPAPNQALQLTASSVRSAPASSAR